MNRNITVFGKTSPYEITLQSKDHPFAVDEYLIVKDTFNNNPLCRVITSEVTYLNNEKVYIATAKVETAVKYPIDAGAVVELPTFADIAPFIMNVKPDDGFVLGEVFGTTFKDLPSEYSEIIAMYANGNVVPQTSVPFVFNYKKLFESPHIGLFGGSGSGKTVAMKVIIEELMKRDIPGILFDPHLEMNFAENKPEIPNRYRVNFASNFEIFTIGMNGFGIDFSDLTTEELVSILSFSGELSGAMESLVRTLHHNGMSLYEIRKLIDDLIEAFNKENNTFEELTEHEKKLLGTYRNKVPAPNTLISISWRLNSLEMSGIFNGTIHKLITTMQNRKMCVLRGSMEQIHIVAAHVIERVYRMRRLYIDAREMGGTIDAEPFPPFFIGMDEAHLFCPNSANFSLTKRIIKTIAQEGRKYGVFELLATQRPALLDETIVAQISNKFIFRLSIKEDIDSIKKETDLNTSELKKLPYMNSGECYVSSSIVGRTMFVKIRYGITMAKNAKNPFDELGSIRELSDVEQSFINHLPMNAMKASAMQMAIKQDTGKTLSVPELMKLGDDLAGRGLILSEKNICGQSFLPKK